MTVTFVTFYVFIGFGGPFKAVETAAKLAVSGVQR